MSHKLISIIIPVYNVEPYLETCLRSAVNQRYSNCEIIIINDGSTDNSLDICEDYARKYDNLRIISQSNQGLGAARNTGIANARGEYYVFLDSDDYLHLDFCSIMYDVVESCGALLAVCHTIRISEKGEALNSGGKSSADNNGLVSAEELFRKINNNERNFCPTAAWGKIYHKSLFLLPENRFPINVYYEDNWLSMKLFLEAEYLCIISDELIYYRASFSSITRMKYFRENCLKDHFVQLADMMKTVFDSNKISNNTKLGFFIRCGKVLGANYFNYLMRIYEARVLSEYFDYTKKYALFGAGIYGKRFRKYILSSVQACNIVFVDNNCNMHGTSCEGIPIVSLDEYICSYRGFELIITSGYIAEIFVQLKNMKVVNQLSELLPNKGMTRIEREFVDGIQYYISVLYECGIL